jgi:hypothetical protein
LAYWTICDELIDGAVDALDLAAPEWTDDSLLQLKLIAPSVWLRSDS